VPARIQHLQKHWNLERNRNLTDLEIDHLRPASRAESSPHHLGKAQRNKNKILRVPQKDMEFAADLAKKKGVHITVTNLSKTKRKKT
jgi:hypothetical protein